MSQDQELIERFIQSIEDLRHAHCDPDNRDGWPTPELQGHEGECHRVPDSPDPGLVIRAKWTKLYHEAMKEWPDVHSVLTRRIGGSTTQVLHARLAGILREHEAYIERIRHNEEHRHGSHREDLLREFGDLFNDADLQDVYANMREAVGAAGTGEATDKATTPTGERVSPEGEWSVPMSLAELGTRLGDKARSNLSADKVKAILEPYGLRQHAGRRQLWTVQLDLMDENLRARIERTK